jgi:hypothetical protein
MKILIFIFVLFPILAFSQSVDSRIKHIDEIVQVINEQTDYTSDTVDYYDLSVDGGEFERFTHAGEVVFISDHRYGESY